VAFRRRRVDSPRVDLTPMVDVVFLLLIFFMISTTFIEQQGVAVNLPRTAASQLPERSQDVLVYLTAQGDVFLMDELVSVVELERQLAGYGDRAATTLFLLSADQQAQHGDVVRLMELARRANFKKLAIATDPEQRQ